MYSTLGWASEWCVDTAAISDQRSNNRASSREGKLRDFKGWVIVGIVGEGERGRGHEDGKNVSER